jgi:hypothetical protein
LTVFSSVVGCVRELHHAGGAEAEVVLQREVSPVARIA